MGGAAAAAGVSEGDGRLHAASSTLGAGAPAASVGRVTFQSDRTPDAFLEMEVIKLILLREGYVKRLRAAVKQLADDDAAAKAAAKRQRKAMGARAGPAQVVAPPQMLLPAAVVETLELTKECSRQIVTAVSRWRASAGSVRFVLCLAVPWW